MSEERATYHPEQHPLGYMPMPSVYAALDFALAVGRESIGTEQPAQRQDAGATAFLLEWLQLGALPSKEQLDQAKSSMREQIDAVGAALTETLRAFVDDLDSHPAPLPGTPYGDYFAELVDLSADRGRHG